MAQKIIHIRIIACYRDNYYSAKMERLCNNLYSLPLELRLYILSLIPPVKLYIISFSFPFLFDDETWIYLCRTMFSVKREFFLLSSAQARERFLEIADRVQVVPGLHTPIKAIRLCLWQKNLATLRLLCRKYPSLAKKVYEERNVSSIFFRPGYEVIAQELNLYFTPEERAVAHVEEKRYSCIKLENLRNFYSLAERLRYDPCNSEASNLLKRIGKFGLCYKPKRLIDCKKQLLYRSYSLGKAANANSLEHKLRLKFTAEEKLSCFIDYYYNTRDFLGFYHLAKLCKNCHLSEEILQRVRDCELWEVSLLFLHGRGAEKNL